MKYAITVFKVWATVVLGLVTVAALHACVGTPTQIVETTPVIERGTVIIKALPTTHQEKEPCK